MNGYLKEIYELPGVDEFKAVAAKWDKISERITKSPTNAPVLLPDMLWIARSGVGKSKLLRLLSEYLATQNNLMKFYGDVKYFEFLLSYCPPDAYFSEIQRLMDEVDNAAGFRSEYKGLVFIDINEWIGHFEEKHFISFMEYLSANSEEWLVILSVNSGTEEELKLMEAEISVYLRLETMKISFPKTEEFEKYAEEYLNGYGMTLSDGAVHLLNDTINVLRNSRFFDGYKTIKMLCSDIVYSVYSASDIKKDMLNADDLSDFSADGEYVEKRIYNIEKAWKIGF